MSDSATTWTVAYQAPPSMSGSYCTPSKSTGVGYFLLQGIFLTQGSNPGLRHCRQMFYPLSHQGSHYTPIKKLILKKGKEAKSYFSTQLFKRLPNLLTDLSDPLSDLMSSFSSLWPLDALHTLLTYSQLWGIFHFLNCSSSSCLHSWLP